MAKPTPTPTSPRRLIPLAVSKPHPRTTARVTDAAARTAKAITFDSAL